MTDKRELERAIETLTRPLECKHARKKVVEELEKMQKDALKEVLERKQALEKELALVWEMEKRLVEMQKELREWGSQDD